MSPFILFLTWTSCPWNHIYAKVKCVQQVVFTCILCMYTYIWLFLCIYVCICNAKTLKRLSTWGREYMGGVQRWVLDRGKGGRNWYNSIQLKTYFQKNLNQTVPVTVHCDFLDDRANFSYDIFIKSQQFSLILVLHALIYVYCIFTYVTEIGLPFLKT